MYFGTINKSYLSIAQYTESYHLDRKYFYVRIFISTTQFLMLIYVVDVII